MKLSYFLSILSLHVFIIGQTVFGDPYDFLKIVLTREDPRITNEKDKSLIEKFYYDDSHNTHMSMFKLGSTEQKMWIQYGTATNLSWIITKNYDKCDQNYDVMKKIRKFYDPTQSPVHYNGGEEDARLYVHNEDFKADNKWAFGTMGGDSVMLDESHASHKQLSNLSFLEVTRASTQYAAGKIDGVISLRYDPKNPQNNFVYRLCNSEEYEKNAIFAFWFPRKKLGPESLPPGELMMCAVDPTRYLPGTLRYTPEIEPGTWRIQMELIGISFDGENTILQQSPQAIFDSTIDRIYGPTKEVTKLHNKLNVRPHPTLPKKRIFDCSRRANLPDFHLRIQGENYMLRGVDYTWEMWQPADNTYVCEVLINPAPIDYWILGDTFLRVVYTVFDITQRIVSFGKTKEPLPQLTRNVEPWAIVKT